MAEPPIYLMLKDPSKTTIGSSMSKNTLGELIDVYHAHRARDPRDRVYALLNMSNNADEDHCIKPDYTKSWSEVFRELLTQKLWPETPVCTWDHRLLAVLCPSLYVLGSIKNIERESTCKVETKNRMLFMGVELSLIHI